MSFLPLILTLALFPLVSAQTPPPQWYAVFYNSTLKAALNETFESTTKITENDQSFVKLEVDHTTIAYNPSNITAYTPRLTEKQSARVLGYAHDEHGQAILLRYIGNNFIPTLNSFPHTTISHQNTGAYTAVYSNDLWARVNASGYVNITFTGGFPDTITFADGTSPVNNSLTFPLPAVVIGNNSYTATTVYVHIIDPTDQPVLEGIFCVNVGWNGSVCTPPTTAASSSSISSSTGQSTTSVSSTTTGQSNNTSISSSGQSNNTSISSSGQSNNTSVSSSGQSSTSSSSSSSTAASSSTGNGPRNDGIRVSINGMTMAVVGIMMLGLF